MRRREFIRLVGGTAAWPLMARAQQPMPVVGWLHSAPASFTVPLVSAFRKGLSEAGFTEHQNVLIEYRHADGQYERLSGLAAELARRPVDAIFAGAPPAALAAKVATTTIPIVFVVGSIQLPRGLSEASTDPAVMQPGSL